ncbi:hypothetical protein GEMRC1_002207 [Eukaryota sp. GEM-RC1]
MDLCQQCFSLLSTQYSLPSDHYKRFKTFSVLETKISDSQKLFLQQMKCLAESCQYIDSISSYSIPEHRLFSSKVVPLIHNMIYPSSSSSVTPNFLHSLIVTTHTSLDMLESILFRIGQFLFSYCIECSPPVDTFLLCHSVLSLVLQLVSVVLSDSPSELSRAGIRSSSHLLILLWCGEVALKGFSLFSDNHLFSLSLNSLQLYLKYANLAENGADTSYGERLMSELLDLDCT